MISEQEIEPDNRCLNIYFGDNTLKSFIKTVRCMTNSDTQRSRRGPGILLPVVPRENENKSKVENTPSYFSIFDIVIDLFTNI